MEALAGGTDRKKPGRRRSGSPGGLGKSPRPCRPFLVSFSGPWWSRSLLCPVLCPWLAWPWVSLSKSRSSLTNKQLNSVQRNVIKKQYAPFPKLYQMTIEQVPERKAVVGPLVISRKSHRAGIAGSGKIPSSCQTKRRKNRAVKSQGVDALLTTRSFVQLFPCVGFRCHDGDRLKIQTQGIIQLSSTSKAYLCSVIDRFAVPDILPQPRP